MASFEIEIKSLLGIKDNADKLIKRLQLDPSFQSLGSHMKLNHYCINGDLHKLSDKLSLSLDSSFGKAKDVSLRTRLADDKVLLVIKATVDDTTSSNGTARMEFETEIGLTLEKLDQALLDCGFEYQAKWSRERQDFKYQGLNVTVDKNAGYGYLAEFEKVIDNQSQADAVKGQIREIMANLGLLELNQDRLARMFDFYNKNWQDYYGTEKVFNIE